MAEEIRLGPLTDGSIQNPDATLDTDNAAGDLNVTLLNGDLVILDTNDNPVMRWDASASEWNLEGQDVSGVNLAAFSDATTDPSTNGELQRNGSDLKAFSGGSVRNFSDIGSGVGGLSVTNVNSNQNTSGSGLYLVDTSGGAVTLTLDTDDATGENAIGVVNVTGDNDVTVDTEGSETIDPGSGSSKTLSSSGWLVWFEGDGTNFDSNLSPDVESIANQDYNESVETHATASGTTTLNLETANVHVVEAVDNVTLEVSNVTSSPAGNSVLIKLLDDDDGGDYSITWGTSWNAQLWDGGTERTTIPASSNIRISGETHDGGSNWWMIRSGEGFSAP